MFGIYQCKITHKSSEACLSFTLFYTYFIRIESFIHFKIVTFVVEQIFLLELKHLLEKQTKGFLVQLLQQIFSK